MFVMFFRVKLKFGHKDTLFPQKHTCFEVYFIILPATKPKNLKQNFSLFKIDRAKRVVSDNILLICPFQTQG